MFRFLPAAIIAAGVVVAAGALSVAEPDVGDKAPRLEVKDLSGKSFSLNAQVQKGPAFINFWATWCVPCREEFPLISGLAKKYQRRGAGFISVALRDKEDAVRKFAKAQKPAQRVAIDKNDAVFNAWDLRAVPTSFLIGKNGKVIAYYDQFDKSDLPAIEADIKRALKTYGK